MSRPVVGALILGPEDVSYEETFLIDTGADRTVFRAALTDRLRLSTISTPSELTIVGVGGTSAFISVAAILEFTRDDGRPTRVHGEYLAFTDPSSTDMSILGRDVLDNFDVILSRRRNEVIFLASNLQYRIAPT